jgi:hypothetical protein
MDMSHEVRPVARRPDARVKSPQRSRVGNGSCFLPGIIDGRSVWIRRAKEVVASHLSDMGGEANCSAAECSIVRRAAILTVELERLESQFAVAGAADANALDQYSRIAGNLRRLLESVGLKRRARDVTTLSDYLSNNAPVSTVTATSD